MARKRWIVRLANSAGNGVPTGSDLLDQAKPARHVKPVFYHCISRVVDKRFAFVGADKEKFRTFMRMQENFTGCRVVSYCLMCNHIHLLVEVPPMPAGGLSDAELLGRLRAIYGEAVVAEVAAEVADARKKVAAGLASRRGEQGKLMSFSWEVVQPRASCPKYRHSGIGEQNRLRRAALKAFDNVNIT